MNTFFQIRTNEKEKALWKEFAKNHSWNLSEFFRLGANMLMSKPELLDAKAKSEFDQEIIEELGTRFLSSQSRRSYPRFSSQTA